MIAIPWGFPTASSILPNKVEFQWIRWSWMSNDREATSLLKALLFRKTDISTTPWPYPYGMVCNNSITDRYKEMTGWIPVLCVTSFLLISQQKQGSVPLKFCFCPDQEYIWGDLQISNWFSTSEGTCRFQIYFIAFLRDIPSGSSWNETPGLVKNMRTHWQD